MVNMQEKRTAKEQRSYSLMPGEVALSYQLGRDPMPVTDRSQVGCVLLEAVPTELMAQVRLPLNFSLVLEVVHRYHARRWRHKHGTRHEAGHGRAAPLANSQCHQSHDPADRWAYRQEQGVSPACPAGSRDGYCHLSPRHWRRLG